MRPSEKVDHGGLKNAPAVTPPPLSVINYIDRYPNLFDVICCLVCRMIPTSSTVNIDLPKIVTWLLLAERSVGITGAVVVPFTFFVLSKRWICRLFRVVRRQFMKAGWLSTLLGCMTGLILLTRNFIWITSF